MSVLSRHCQISLTSFSLYIWMPWQAIQAFNTFIQSELMVYTLTLTFCSRCSSRPSPGPITTQSSLGNTSEILETASLSSLQMKGKKCKVIRRITKIKTSGTQYSVKSRLSSRKNQMLLTRALTEEATTSCCSQRNQDKKIAEITD